MRSSNIDQSAAPNGFGFDEMDLQQDSEVPLHKKLERPFPRNPSVIADECGWPKERSRDVLLRPMYINGVEVGYSYGEATGKKGVSSIKGCLITLWYFILRGHDAKLFFPHCYRRYTEKTDDHQLLTELARIGLVQFTQGQGQEKYNELSRVLAANARRFGGCIVACSSLRRVFEENQIYHRIVQKRVLVPCFVGNEVLFPADGPEGRVGLRFSRTIVATPEDEDYEAAKVMQMKLEYQVRMVNLLRELHPNSASLGTISERMNDYLKEVFRANRNYRPNYYRSEPSLDYNPRYGTVRRPMTNTFYRSNTESNYIPSMNPSRAEGYTSLNNPRPRVTFLDVPNDNLSPFSGKNPRSHSFGSFAQPRPTTHPSMNPSWSEGRFDEEDEYIVYSYVGGKRKPCPTFY
ncbi:unnamed protein product [Bursaphelenchus okinawaensis]|uniref:RNase NYN domain-containing protein n=1 Tax=Bursaphelenchus okinawaensis TaxID=465554 RepID=A0A811KA46_9BILA|nr:unnamed protein product [Bursaphelenchus okinawaensis]CAG9096891.1 unnamed protein product [Bursaphelenchus okinawaensis]